MNVRGCSKKEVIKTQCNLMTPRILKDERSKSSGATQRVFARNERVQARSGAMTKLGAAVIMIAIQHFAIADATSKGRQDFEEDPEIWNIYFSTMG